MATLDGDEVLFVVLGGSVYRKKFRLGVLCTMVRFGCSRTYSNPDFEVSKIIDNFMHRVRN